MINNNLKLNSYLIGTPEISSDIFCESLLVGMVNAKNECARLDAQINRIGTSFVAYNKAMDCYDAILDQMTLKNDLIELYKLFAKWYKQQNELNRKLFVAYFVKQDKKLCVELSKNSHFHERYISRMARSFMHYVTVMSDYTMKKLIANPYIYKTYVNTFVRNERWRRKRLARAVRDFETNKGESAYDNSADEGCHC